MRFHEAALTNKIKFMMKLK